VASTAAIRWPAGVTSTRTCRARARPPRAEGVSPARAEGVVRATDAAAAATRTAAATTATRPTTMFAAGAGRGSDLPAAHVPETRLAVAACAKMARANKRAWPDEG
jgi:hypothetical protein